MDFETFDRLHKSDPLLFSLAMEVFLDKGRVAVQESGGANHRHSEKNDGAAYGEEPANRDPHSGSLRRNGYRDIAGLCPALWIFHR